MTTDARSFRNSLGYMIIFPAGFLLYFLSRSNYLLFHGLAELSGIIIATGISIIAWNSRHLVKQHFLLFIGLGYPFIALIGILHTFSYKGLSVFAIEYGANLPTQLWIAGRYLESCTFLVATIFISRRLRPAPVLTSYIIIITMILSTIFVWPVFPDCYIEGIGLTPFKTTSEYIIILIWIVMGLILLSNRQKLDAPVLQQLLLTIGCNIIAEISFTLYIDIYGFFNFFGHFLRIVAVYFLYQAIIEKSLNDPHNSLFREINLSDKYFRSLYETAPLAFVVWDENRHIIQWNKTAEKIFGWSSVEVQGSNFFEFLVPEQDQPTVNKMVDALQHGNQTNNIINANLTKDGRTITCDWSHSILQAKDGNAKRFLSLGLDITEQKKAAELQQKHSEMIKRFAYSVAHDLKNPADSLSAIADLFQRKYGDALDDRGRLFCDHIKKTSIQISDLVQNINTYIVAKELPLALKTIDLQELLGQLREEFAGLVKERNITWVVPTNLPPINGDPVALLRIMRNFVDNALKYGGNKLSKIEIFHKETPEHHQLFVRDDGVGLPPHGEKKIFEIFQRGHTATGTSGAGLGLTITRELAEKMGGEVWHERPSDNGAIFCTSIAKKL